MAWMFEDLEEMKSKMKEDGFEYVTSLKGYYDTKTSWLSTSTYHMFAKKIGNTIICNMAHYGGVFKLEYIEPITIDPIGERRIEVNARVYDDKVTKLIGRTHDIYFNAPVLI